jgi:hypothetical protein
MLLDFLVCDDIREEKSNKLTLVGVYNTFIGVASSPAILPKLGFFIRLAPQADFAPEKYTLRIKRDTEALATVEGKLTITDAPQPSTIVVVGSPFLLPAPCVLRFELTLHRGQDSRDVRIDRSIEVKVQGRSPRISSISQT